MDRFEDVSCMSRRCVFKLIDSPVGALQLVASDHALVAVVWADEDPKRVPLELAREASSHPILVEAARQLREYFGGQRRAFTVPLELRGTRFQERVWGALLTIPFGETRSYRQIAQQIGAPRAVRAVGAANGKNPISIIAPCHRMVGSTGRLTGFAGGLEAKAWLLELEGVQRQLWPGSGAPD